MTDETTEVEPIEAPVEVKPTPLRKSRKYSEVAPDTFHVKLETEDGPIYADLFSEADYKEFVAAQEDLKEKANHLNDGAPGEDATTEVQQAFMESFSERLNAFAASKREFASQWFHVKVKGWDEPIVRSEAEKNDIIFPDQVTILRLVAQKSQLGNTEVDFLGG